MSDKADVAACGSDVFILLSHGESAIYLAQEMIKQMEFVETVMCKANCDDVLKIAHALDSIRDDIQKWYDMWKHREFTK